MPAPGSGAPTSGLPALGGVFLDNVRFSTDPVTYEALNWKKRYSVHQTIGGKVIIQDFGTFMKDNTLKLVSGEIGLDEATVVALHSRWRTQGATFTYTDWRGNNFIVYIKDFIPVIVKVDLYKYTMDLQVVTINQLWGVTYTGS